MARHSASGGYLHHMINHEHLLQISFSNKYHRIEFAVISKSKFQLLEAEQPELLLRMRRMAEGSG